MGNKKISDKFKQILSMGFVVFAILFLIALFVFKDKLTDFSSKMKQSQVSAEITQTESHRVDSAYNYVKNGLPYKYTFLEFGATGCSSCKRMEGVMADIRAMYPELVNVNFINVRLPENQKIMEYFGIVVIPTQVLLDKDGKEYFRHTGYFPTDELKRKFL